MLVEYSLQSLSCMSAGILSVKNVSFYRCFQSLIYMVNCTIVHSMLFGFVIISSSLNIKETKLL